MLCTIYSLEEGTSGIGKATVLELATHHPARVYFTGRNAEAGANVVAEAKQLAPACNVTFIRCDLSSKREAIRTALVNSFDAKRLDFLILNAGIMAVPPGLSDEGYEVQFGTNVMGHAILLHLLRPVMLRTAALSDADVRFVSLSSSGHTMHLQGGIQFDSLRIAEVGNTWQRYGQSKLGNILLARGMAHQFPQITSVAVHPGLVGTDLANGIAPGPMRSALLFAKWMRLPVYKTLEQGAENTLWAVSVSKETIENGAYYVPVGKRTTTTQAKAVEDVDLRDRFWEWLEGELEGLEPL